MEVSIISRKAVNMEKRLKKLAERLKACRKKGNRMSLENILESARILAEAKSVAKRRFTKWLREEGRMDSSTAYRHLQVAAFVRRNRASMHEIATLGMVKIYALSTLSLRRARRILKGKEMFSASLHQLSDLQFKKDFRERFPILRKPGLRHFVARVTLSALVQAEIAMRRADRHEGRMTTTERQRIVNKVQVLARIVAKWRIAG